MSYLYSQSDNIQSPADRTKKGANIMNTFNETNVHSFVSTLVLFFWAQEMVHHSMHLVEGKESPAPVASPSQSFIKLIV